MGERTWNYAAVTFVPAAVTTCIFRQQPNLASGCQDMVPKHPFVVVLIGFVTIDVAELPEEEGRVSLTSDVTSV
jgi:hypothetical protein